MQDLLKVVLCKPLVDSNWSLFTNTEHNGQLYYIDYQYFIKIRQLKSTNRVQ
jgi:hypothetical protein